MTEIVHATLVGNVERLREIGESIASLASQAKELRQQIVTSLQVAGHKLPKPVREDEETGPPLRFIMGNHVVSVSAALIAKDFTITFEELPRLYSGQAGTDAGPPPIQNESY